MNDLKGLSLDFIKDIAIDVLREIGSGHSESIYHSAMEYALMDARIPFHSHVPITIYYKSHPLEKEEADLLVIVRDDERRVGIIVELKIGGINEKDSKQGLKYIEGIRKAPQPMVDEVYHESLTISFPQESTRKFDGEVEEVDGVQFLVT